MLERDVVFAATARVRRFLGEGWGRGGRAPRDRALGAAHELHAFGDDLGGRTLLAVLALPIARLQPALHKDLAAFVEVFAARLGLLAPDDDGEEARFLTLLAGPGRVIPVDCHPEVRVLGAAGRLAEPA